MPAPILVTGSTGFLASHIVLQLLRAGHAVRGSVRNPVRAKGLRAALERHGAETSRLEFVTLDLGTDDGWLEAMAGVEYLIHTASPFVTTIPDDPDSVIRPAVDGTRRALNAALAAGVKRIVLTSSEAAIVRARPRGWTEPLTEDDWSDPDSPDITPYFISKTLAEREAWAIMETAGRRADLTVVNPGLILGPLLDQDVGTSGALIRNLMANKVPGLPALWFSIVDVRDVAELHVRAMTDERGFGHRVLSANAPVSFRDIAAMLAAGFPDRRITARKLPDMLVRFIALFDNSAAGAVPFLGYKSRIAHGLDETMLGRPLIDSRAAVIAMAQSQIDQSLV